MALATLTPGTIFARDFLVHTLVAEGGMGAVYRAEQRSTGNAVALKIMLPELLVDPRSREKFEHEARVSGRIRSSHVVKVLAAGIDDATQTPWLAMEFLEGESLAAFAKARGPLAPEVVLAVLQQVGHALSAAHVAGVVHCDLKPENIFIADSQTLGVPFDVKVLDFGIARIVKEGRQSATVTTAVGSPHWLAPEQGSKGKTVSPATDVWSFGLIAFWMLTGRFYWMNANVPDDEYNVYSLLGEIAGRDAIVPAGERLRALGEHRALLPAGFDEWFMRCVDRDVSRRFATGKEAEEGLAVALAIPRGTAVAATRSSLPSVPVGLTQEMTIGVSGLAPSGYPVGGASELIGDQARPSVPRLVEAKAPSAALGTGAVKGLGQEVVTGAPTPTHVPRPDTDLLNDVRTVSSRARYSVGMLCLTTLMLGWDIATKAYSLIAVHSFQQGDGATRTTLEQADSLVLYSGYALLSLRLVTAIGFLRWIYRLVATTRALDGDQLRWKPRDAVWAFFIPVINFLRPYAVLRDVGDVLAHRAMRHLFLGVPGSQPDSVRGAPESSGPSPSGPRTLIAMWWGTFIGGNLVAMLAAAVSADTTEAMFKSYQVLIAANVIEMVAAVLAVFMIRVLTSRLAERCRRITNAADADCGRLDMLSTVGPAAIGILWMLAITRLLVSIDGGATTPAQPDAATPSAIGELAPDPAPVPAPAPTCPEGMALIPAGTFAMGSSDGQGRADEHPQHQVQLSAFCMDRTEVTVAAYRDCVSAGNCTPAAATVDLPGITASARANMSLACQANRTGVDQHPINCVDWTQAVAFCRYHEAQLPTEAQWEYAARGTDGRTYPWGNDAPGSQLCWNRVLTPDSTCPVSSYPSGNSPFGLFDMAGNVMEWTADWYAPYPAQTVPAMSDPPGPTNGTAAATSRVLHGGGWDFSDPVGVRAASRFSFEPTNRDSFLGFRCARGTI